MTISVGETAPDFNLYNQEGNQTSLGSMKGGPVVLAFFPAAFTGVCQKEMCTLQDSLSKFSDLGAQVAAVSTDSRFSNAEFAKQNNLSFPVLSDYTRTTIKDYGVEFRGLGGMEDYISARRSVFVIDGIGTVRWTWISDLPSQEPPYDEIERAVGQLG